MGLDLALLFESSVNETFNAQRLNAMSPGKIQSAFPQDEMQKCSSQRQDVYL